MRNFFFIFTRESSHCTLQADKSFEPLPIILSEISHLQNCRVGGGGGGGGGGGVGSGGGQVGGGLGWWGVRVDVNAIVGGGGDVGYGGCEPGIEGFVQCTNRYCTILSK